jgi:curli biogenesis system outer membrane secretion channel CsgG
MTATSQGHSKEDPNVRKSVVVGLCCALLVGAVVAAHAAAASKPRVAVLEFKNKADNQWWYHGGAEAAQDVFVTELVKSGRFRVIEREQLAALMQEKNLSLSGDVDPKTAIRAGKLLGVDYLLTGAVTEYGSTDTSVDTPGGVARGHWVPGVSVGKKSFVAAMNARLIDTETGEILWADEGRGEESNARVHVGGFGGGVDNDQRMFDKVLKPVIQQLVASLKAADI